MLSKLTPRSAINIATQETKQKSIQPLSNLGLSRINKHTPTVTTLDE